MDRTHYTFLIFSGAHGKFRRVQLPFYVIHLTLAFSIVGILTVAALANSYTRMLLKVSDYNSLRTEREALKNQYRSLEDVVSETNAKLDSLRSLAAEVALTYGFGAARQARFPQGLLALGTEGPSRAEAAYRTSLYAFNLMKSAALNSLGDAVALDLFSNVHIDRTTVPSIWPVRGQVTAGVGQRMGPFSGEGAFHAGMDISDPYGTRVEAAAEGMVFYGGARPGDRNEGVGEPGLADKAKKRVLVENLLCGG